MEWIDGASGGASFPLAPHNELLICLRSAGHAVAAATAADPTKMAENGEDTPASTPDVSGAPATPGLGTGGALKSPSEEREGPPAPEFQIVAAIDFGTTFSGYAYSFASDKETIHVNRNWGQTQGFLLHKTPTCLLLNPEGQFLAFGFEAVSRYNELGDDEAASHYYFDRFKMNLYDNKVSVLFVFWPHAESGPSPDIIL